MKRIAAMLILSALAGCASQRYEPVYLPGGEGYYIQQTGPAPVQYVYVDGPLFYYGLHPWWAVAYVKPYYAPYYNPYYFSPWYPAGPWYGRGGPPSAGPGRYSPAAPVVANPDRRRAMEDRLIARDARYQGSRAEPSRPRQSPMRQPAPRMTHREGSSSSSTASGRGRSLRDQ